MRQAPLQKPRGVSPSPHMASGRARDLWRGLAFIAPFVAQKGEGISALLDANGHPLAGANLVAGSTLQWRGTPYGLGVGISGASNLFDQTNWAPIVTSDGAGTADLTMLVFANPPAEARRSVPLGQSNASAAPRIEIFFNAGSGGASTSGGFMVLTGSAPFSHVAGVIDGAYHLFGVRRAGLDTEAWVDGLLRATQSFASPEDVYTAGATDFAIGNRTNSTDRISTSANIVFAAGWNRALSNDEMQMLARDPFCMFRPVQKRPVLYLAAAGGITGTLAVTEESDVVAATGALPVAGVATITEDADTLSATGTVALAGAASITEAGDTLTASATLSLSGAASITEASDTVSAAGAVSITGALAVTEAGDTLVATGSSSALITGILDATEAGDSVAAAGALNIAATLSATEAADTVAATGVITIAGAAAIIEASDTLAAAGAVKISGAASLQEADDAIGATGALAIAGAANITEDGDTIAASSVVPTVVYLGKFMVSAEARTFRVSAEARTFRAQVAA